MKDNNNNRLLVLALFCSIVGLAILYVLASSMEPVEVQIREIESHAGETVKVLGTVERISINGNGTVFLTISDSEDSSVEAVFFARSAQKMPLELASLSKGVPVCVAGKVSSYNGKAEILGERLC